MSYESYCHDQGIDCARRAGLARSPDVATYWRSLGFRWLRLAEQAQITGGAFCCNALGRDWHKTSDHNSIVDGRLRGEADMQWPVKLRWQPSPPQLMEGQRVNRA
jgi:hypothetical protein